MSVIDQLNETVAFLKGKIKATPQIGVVLGSGLGNFVSELDIDVEIPYGDIPHFPISTVEGHSGKLIFASLAGKQVVCMAGRFHFYEGYDAADVAYPIRAMKWLGVETLLLSNAAGTMNPTYKVGDLMIIKDHISLFAPNPLIGKNIPELGTRFPDMSEPYSHELIKKAVAVAGKLGYELKQGVYVGVTGPTFETHAEYRMLNILGGDAVGMSTVQENIVARHMGMPVFALSIITDIGIREDHNIITHQEVLDAANAATPRMTAIFKGLISEL